MRPLGEVALSDAETEQVNALYAALNRALAQSPGTDKGAAGSKAWRDWAAGLAQFIALNPDSAWTPGLSLQLGGEYRTKLNHSGAADALRRAWTLTRDRTEPAAVEIAGEAARQWGELLVMSGQFKEFDALLAEHRANTGVQTGGSWYKATELRTWLARYPDEAWKCGLQSLDQLAKLSQPELYVPQAILMQPADPLGYDASALLRVAQGANLNAKAIYLSDVNAGIPVPSILHMTFGHYIAVRRKDGEFYEVLDPTSAKPAWLTAQDLAQDASGLFIVNASNPLVGLGAWRSVDRSEVALYRGRCYHGSPFDADSAPPCVVCPCGPGGPSSASTSDASCASCQSKAGMPEWWIDEPYLNLWIRDTPLEYTPLYGPKVALTLTFRSRSDIGMVANRPPSIPRRTAPTLATGPARGWHS